MDLPSLVRAADSLEFAAAVIVDALTKRLAQVVRVSEQNIAPSKPLHIIGVDSLIAVESRYWFLRRLESEVAVYDVLKNQPLLELCRAVAGKVRGGQ